MITLPQLTHHVTIIGSDGLFHYNQFYDAAMQIKHHNFSYFVQLYGFENSGRIVTAIYSPFVTYLLGGLLLICGSFYKFAIVTRLLFFILASVSMRLALRMTKARHDGLAQLAAVIYAFSPAVIGWGISQNFSSLGAILIPLVIGCGVRMVNDPQHPINWLQLGVVMAILVQTHLATVLQAVVLLAVYAGVALMVNRKSRVSLLKNGLAAVALCLALSLNVIAGMLELYQDNQVVPIATFDFKDGNGVYHLFQLSSGQWVNLFFMLIVAAILVGLFRQLPLAFKLTGVLSIILFLLATTLLVDWPQVMKTSAFLSHTLQFPGRLKGPATALALILMADVGNHQLAGNRTKWLTTGLAGVMVAFILVNMQANFRYDAKASRAVLATEKATIPKVKRTPKLKRRLIATMREPLSARTINLVTKSTPDYMPANDFDRHSVYNEYQRKIIKTTRNTSHQRRHGFTKTVASHRIKVTWQGKGTHRNVPVAYYANTHFKLNGKVVTPQASRGVIRVPRVKERRGANQLIVTYQPRKLSQILVALAIVNWLGLLGYVLVRWLRLRHPAG